MRESHKEMYRQTVLVLIGQIICTGIMFGVYAILQNRNITEFGWPEILGGLIGALLATGNFFATALIATLAADKAEQQDVAGGKKLIKASYPVRLLVLAGLLVLCAVTKWFDLLALVLPLAYMPVIILVMGTIQKRKGA